MKVTQSCLTLCEPMDYRVHRILQARILEWAAFPFLQGIFLIQGSNPGFPHCRRILYQLSYQGIPIYIREYICICMLLLSRFSRVRLCATPQTAAHQAPPSLGFSRQEHWSGWPFPSPMHESEKWKWSRSVMSDSLGPHGLQPTRLLHPRDFPGKSTGVGCHCLGLRLVNFRWNQVSLWQHSILRETSF